MRKHSFSKRSILFVVLAVFALSVLALGQACAQGGAKIRIAYTNKGDYLPMIVALKNAYFQKHGVNVEKVLVTGGIEAAEAVTTGSADIALMGDVPALISTTAPSPGYIVALYSADEKRHHLVVSPSSNIKKPKDLEGKRFAVQHGSSTHGGFMMYCAKHKVDIKKINMVKISPRDMPEAMATGQIDAMAGSNPWPSNVIKRNPKAVEFAAFSGLGCDYPLAMVASKNMVTKRGKDLALVMKAFNDAIQYIRTNPAQSANMMAPLSGMKVADELTDIKNATWELTLDKKSVDGLKKLSGFLYSASVLRKEPNWNKAIINKFVAPYQPKGK